MSTPISAPPVDALDPSCIGLGDRDLAYAAGEVVCGALFPREGDPRAELESLPTHWRVVWFFCTLEDDVLEGGFHQFFTNSRGCFDASMLEDARRLGDPRVLAILEAALEEYRLHDYRVQWRNLGHSHEVFLAPYNEGRFSALDSQFWRLDPTVRVLLGRFIRSNLSEFISIPCTSGQSPSSRAVPRWKAVLSTLDRVLWSPWFWAPQALWFLVRVSTSPATPMRIFLLCVSAAMLAVTIYDRVTGRRLMRWYCRPGW